MKMIRSTIFPAAFTLAICSFVCLTAQAQTPDELLVQGEYTGTIKTGDEEIKAGVQLIARGDNKFEIVAYHNGLPGDGWKVGDDIKRGDAAATLENDKLVFDRHGELIVYEHGVLKFVQNEEEAGRLERVVRESETLGLKPPEKSVVLFDGSSGDEFEAKNDEPVMIDGLLRPGVTSQQSFGGDFTLHIEFKLPFEPTKSGQARGNSGIYLQGRYEVQMLDSFGLTGEQNECGGIYSVKKPDVNMCYPPEAWQTYDIDFTSAKWDGDTKTANARMTVKHNGVLIHDDVEVPSITTAAPLKESAEPGYIYLQDHGSPVRYRNIWVVQK